MKQLELDLEPKYEHVFDVSFSVISTKQDPEDVPLEDLIIAMASRLSGIARERNLEAFGIVDTNPYDADWDPRQEMIP